MSSVFVVRGAPPSTKSTATWLILVVVGPLLAVLGAQVYTFNGTSWGILPVTVLLLAFAIAFLLAARSSADKDSPSLEVSVTVLPLGVQLVTKKKGVPVSTPTYLAREEILDVIVNEIIFAHKVVSIVVFRLLKDQGAAPENYMTNKKDKAKHSMALLLKEGRVQLIPAFPGVEMSYTDCMSMRRDISKSLGLD
jgi:hypothetical protein